MPKGKSGIKRGGGKGGNGGKTVAEEMVRGVPQSQIDKLRGTGDHQAPYSITWQDVQAQYAKVGINITDQQAQAVHSAVESFSGDDYTPMRNAMLKYQKGEPLTHNEQQYLDKYRLCEEWCKVAPVFRISNQSEVYRGLERGYNAKTIAYAEGIKALKVGDTFDLGHMPSSFSTRYR